MCVCVHTCVHVCACDVHKHATDLICRTCRSQFPPFTMWFPGFKVRSAALVTVTITHWAISLSLNCWLEKKTYNAPAHPLTWLLMSSYILSLLHSRITNYKAGWTIWQKPSPRLKWKREKLEWAVIFYPGI